MKQNNNIKTNIIMFALIAALLVGLVIVLAVTKEEKSPKGTENLLNINYEIEGNEMNLEQYNTTNPVVAMYIEDYGTIVIELYPEIAPNTVNNFISLVK